jgi:hypothetical protein
MPIPKQGHTEEELLSQICFAGPNEGLVLGASKGALISNKYSKPGMLIHLKLGIFLSGIDDLVLSVITWQHLQAANSHA